MANLIPWKKINKKPRGSVIWEEWITTGIAQPIVIHGKRLFSNSYYVVDFYSGDQRLIHEDSNYRYWDAPPSLQQRLRTPWFDKNENF